MGEGSDNKKQKGSVELHQNTVKIACLNLTTKHSRVWSNNTGAIKTEECGYCNAKDKFIRFGLPGSSDIIGVYKGLFIGVEVKTGDAVQSPKQKKFQKMICNMGGIYVLIRDTNVNQLLNIVEQKYQEILNA